MRWKDDNEYSAKATTNYDNPCVKAAIIVLGKFKLTIHHHVDHPPKVWFAGCHGLFWMHKLENLNVDLAKKEALHMLEEVLKTSLEEIKKWKEVIEWHGKALTYLSCPISCGR